MFVAPTKPLVAQQVMACHGTCGIPAKDSIELTGEVLGTTRIRYVSCVPLLVLFNHSAPISGVRNASFS